VQTARGGTGATAGPPRNPDRPDGRTDVLS